MSATDPPAAVRRRVVVRGRVQGVYFRQSCRATAEDAGVAGWVRNRSDGTVEAVLEGEPAAVERVVAWCGRGPRAALVAGVDVVDEPVEGLTGFRVR